MKACRRTGTCVSPPKAPKSSPANGPMRRPSPSPREIDFGRIIDKLIHHMKYRSALLLALLPAIFLVHPLPSRAASPKPLMVHYMPWFQTPYSLGGTSYGLHWTLKNYFG